LSSAEIGAVNAFLHYNLGAGGGPSAALLGYLATYNQHTQSLYRAGLIELPLMQSPGQRLDDLTQYGYYGIHAGLNDLTLASPRWGLPRPSRTREWRGISTAVGPSTRSMSVPGSCASLSPAPMRGHWIFSGTEWAAISGPTISCQRVTISAEAKPCLRKV